MMKKFFLLGFLLIITFKAAYTYAEESSPTLNNSSICINGLCTIFSVTVAIDTGETNNKIKMVKEHIGPGEGDVKYSFYTVMEKKLNKCTKSVQVPEDIFHSVTYLLKHISGQNSDGTPPPALTPAQQTMLLFFSTIMQQTLGFDCSKMLSSSNSNSTRDTNNSSASDGANDNIDG